MKTSKLKILFICTGNSCRSQMAEGWARYLKGDIVEPSSAGVIAHGMLPHTIKVMAEAGVDISNQYSKSVDELKDQTFDYVITLCDHAAKHCPVFPAKVKVIHVPFDDPLSLSSQARSEDEALNIYRRIRDEIGEFIQTFSP